MSPVDVQCTDGSVQRWDVVATASRCDPSLSTGEFNVPRNCRVDVAANEQLPRMGGESKPWRFIQADATRLPLESNSVDLVIGSPPYLSARHYLENGENLGIARDLHEWVAWMLEVTTEACRVSRGLVLWVCAGCTTDRIYQPGPEGLLYEWVKRGGVAWRPCYWHRVGIPGSGGKHWLRADVEYVLAFKRTAEWPEFSDNTANGHPPKWAPGGEMSNRQSNGARVNQWGGVGSERGMGAKKSDGSFRPSGRPSHINQWGHSYATGATAGDLDNVTCAAPRPSHRRLERGNEKGPCLSPVAALANPGNLVKVIVGGGVMGHPLAHLNEAPFPLDLASWFIRSHCPPGGTVLDCFSGSGTTVDAAWRLGRIGIGTDLRMSQCELGTRRMNNPNAVKKSSKPVEKNAPSLFAEVAP
jgi:hypothetical protein